ncbi:MAG TPA: hypothetical protein VGG85_04725 [Terracidiphilus sp.]|jgi:hypothetical protein
MFSTAIYLKRLKNANIGYEKSGTGTYKGDYYVTGGSSTPHIHVASSGLFVGLKGKRGAITTLVNQGNFNIDTINSSIDELKDSLAANDVNITNALLELARQYKFGS